MNVLPGTPGSCWLSTAPRASYPAAERSSHAHTVVIGGGIVGLTTALRLCEAGSSVIVLEALGIGGQVTGRSTAKITTQHALIYRHLMETRGRELARAYADANRSGVTCIKDWIALYDIACDLESKAAYAYTTSPARSSEIRAEADAAREMGLEAEAIASAPLPFETAGALLFPGQAQFNPASYLIGLARAVVDRGGQVFENSRAILIEEASRWRVVTDNGATVHAEHVVVATNMTVKSPVGMANRTQPRSHVAMAFRADDPNILDGMFIGIDEPTHSLRMGRDAEGPLLVALGPKFNTGQDGNVAARFNDLEQWVTHRFPVRTVAWRWCNEDYDTADRVAFAGTPDLEKAAGFHIATGFNAWGISNGTAAGIMIADLISGKSSPWTKLYDPARRYPEDFHKNADSQSIVGSVEDIAPGQGGVLVRGEEKVAAWRDDAGTLHAVSATCTHKGCTVTWNNADRTWDCPCHGSIFAADGSVIHGPARKPLPSARL
ncbi:MAG TPA: FAD-dependent oxidoreductase [Rhizobiaceae bacterium]|nr:FAD-dependent oxidoreductase [Rhizobiaceae bacterium]